MRGCPGLLTPAPKLVGNRQYLIGGYIDALT